MLPIVVVAIMLVQQAMQPVPKDPQQAATHKMMKFFFVFLAVMFYNLPSGLLVYWGTSSAIGLVESHLVKKSLAPLPGTLLETESQARSLEVSNPVSLKDRAKSKKRKKR